MRKIKSKVLLCTLLALSTSLYGQTNEPSAKKWGAEFNILWPIFPGNLIRTQMTRSIWQNENIKGDLLFGAGVHYSMVQGWKTFYDPTGEFYNNKFRASLFMNFGSH